MMKRHLVNDANFDCFSYPSFSGSRELSPLTFLSDSHSLEKESGSDDSLFTLIRSNQPMCYVSEQKDNFISTTSPDLFDEIDSALCVTKPNIGRNRISQDLFESIHSDSTASYVPNLLKSYQKSPDIFSSMSVNCQTHSPSIFSSYDAENLRLGNLSPDMFQSSSDSNNDDNDDGDNVAINRKCCPESAVNDEKIEKQLDNEKVNEIVSRPEHLIGEEFQQNSSPELFMEDVNGSQNPMLSNCEFNYQLMIENINRIQDSKSNRNNASSVRSVDDDATICSIQE